jgi:hypothetical protein
LEVLLAVDSKAELRTNWRANWLGSIEEIANLEAQRATWLNPDNHNPHYTFIEYVECYFDGLVLNENEGGYDARISEGLISVAEAYAVQPFHELFDQYSAPCGDDFDHDAILADAGWRKVVEAAQHARVRLAALIHDPSELRILSEPSDHARLAARRSADP